MNLGCALFRCRGTTWPALTALSSQLVLVVRICDMDILKTLILDEPIAH
jgi:hypothetical protein